MSTMPPEIRDGIAEISRWLDDVEALWPTAVDYAAERSPLGRTRRYEVARGALGDYNDPTADTVADPRRLALAAEIRRHERALSVLANVAAHLLGRTDVPPLYVRKPEASAS